MSRPSGGTILVALLITAMALMPVVAFALAPHAPSSLVAAAGQTQPVVAHLTWNPSADAVSYSVSAATSGDGPFKYVGSSETTGYDFEAGLGGIGYYFAVSAVNDAGELSEPARTASPVTAAWVSDPHATATATTNKCASCHVPHAALASPLMRTEVSTDTPGQEATCLTCHDGKISVAANVSTGARDSFGLRSGHALDTSVSAGGLTNDCASCHNPHGSAEKTPMIPMAQLNGLPVSSNRTDWCFACHDDGNSWYPNPSTYPTASAPQRDAAGYPVTGTWLGKTAYTGAGNAHRLIPDTTQTAGSGQQVLRVKGDCLYCHAAHRGPNVYDGLVALYRPTTSATLVADKTKGDYAALCFTCHGGTKPSGFAQTPVDIRSIVTSTGPSAGHSIVTSGGLLPVGAPLPCYECHNPHGSTRGNDSLLSDARGGSLETSTSSGIREFCFTCHTTSATAKGWDSASATYTAVGGDKVVGIARTGGALKLPTIAGHGQTDGASCYTCHGRSYAAGGSNVHNPGAGTAPSHVSRSYSCWGPGCHATSADLVDVHAEFVGSAAAKYPQYATSCDLCHSNDNPNRINWSTATMVCSSCHPIYHGVPAGQPVTHGDRTSGHTITAASAACIACHPGSLPAIHKAPDRLPTDCANCHSIHASPLNAACDKCHASVTVWSKSADCADCHPQLFDGSAVGPNHYNETTHTAVPFKAAAQGTGADGSVAAGGKECADCHSSTLKSAHRSTSTNAGSVTCPECHNDTSLGSKAIVSAGWPAKKCTDCHDTGAATTHGSFALVHLVAGGTCAGTGTSCHDYTDLSALHASAQLGGAPKYQSCSNADPDDPTGCHKLLDTRPAAFDPLASCGVGTSGCHQEKSPVNHGYSAAKHLAAPGSGDVVMGAGAGDTDHGPDWSTNVECSTCHFVDLGTQHANQCAVCHSGANPVASLGTWNKSCQQGACHPAIHTGMTPNHGGAYWNSSRSCDSCHTGVPQWPGEVDCARCHAPSDTIPDAVAPTTSSDATSTYTGNAAIHLTSVDNLGGTGVDRTYYILDGNTAVLGAVVSVPAPAVGSQVHTLQFYSVDRAGNMESFTPTPAFSFTVNAAPDTTPPAGTMSVNSGADDTTSAVVTVNSSVSDSGSGIDQMSIDPGTGVFGPWIAYSATTSVSLTGADGSKTVRVRYSDRAGNVATLTDTILLDTTAPTTSSNAAASYVGPASITLTAVDNAGGSGVATTYYRVDSGTNQVGASIIVAAPPSGSAIHTVYFWSVDRAGKTETESSKSFTVFAPLADTVAPTTSSSFNPAAGAVFNSAQSVTLSAADTGGSGLKETYYRLDAGTYTTSTTFSIAGDGLHTFSYYSADSANNTETVHVSNQFRIDATPPVTTSSIAAGTTYTGAQLFTLAPDDQGGSGVASTWYQLDQGAWSPGTSVLVAAPAIGTISHTIRWYSVDLAANQETTNSATFSVVAPISNGTTTLSFRTNASFGGWSYVHWEVLDSDGNLVPGMVFENDDPGHPSSMWADFVVPAGQSYTMTGSWGPMPDGPDVDSATRVVTPGEASAGGTVTWWWY